MNLSMVLFAQIVMAVVAGFAVAYQPGVNAKLAQAMPHPLHAAIVSFFCGFAILAIAGLLMRISPPQMQKLAGVPWWSWLGGALGAFFVLTAIVLVPQMGSTSYLACIIAGQLAGSVIIDHFGHMGLAEHPFTPGRAAGILLLVAGAVCIKVF